MNFDFTSGVLINGCLRSNGNLWHIAYVRNNQIIAKNCFKTNPNWMENNLAVIGNKKLHEIVIPGTHDSGCYSKSGLITRASLIDVLSKFSK